MQQTKKWICRLLVGLFIFSIVSGAWAEPPRKIAVFGSSVACGAADDQAKKGGYAGRLKDLLEKRGWSVANVSRGGDNTVSIQPRIDGQLLPQKPGYVLIGLSLGNEGLTGAKTQQAREQVCKQYQAGLRGLINRLRDQGIQPVVGLCYANSLFDSGQYEFTRRTNLAINGWDVPSVNFLGAIDDGQGKWAAGCEGDALHPNSRGHEEMFYAIVPTLFDAMAVGKPVPRRVRGEGFVRINGDSKASSSFSFTPKDPIHSFAVGFQFRVAGDGVIASIKREKGRVALEVKEGKLVYLNAAGKPAIIGVLEPGKWAEVVVSHRYAKGEMLIFLNGKLQGTVREQFLPLEFVLGGSGKSPKEADYRQWLVYRSSLNADEVKALYEGKLLQASLEIYVPLEGRSEGRKNRAQSLSVVEEVTRR
jgi:lysophospholipase L1-like esterase